MSNVADSIEQTLARDGYIIHTVTGTSMQPMLNQETDFVKIVPAVQPLKVGDLPLYKRPDGQYILHRIIAVKKSYYIARGDNRRVSEKVPFEWVIGVTEGFYKNGKYISGDDEVYQKYVEERCRFHRIRACLLRYRFFRGLRKIKMLLTSHGRSK